MNPGSEQDVVEMIDGETEPISLGAGRRRQRERPITAGVFMKKRHGGEDVVAQTGCEEKTPVPDHGRRHLPTT